LDTVLLVCVGRVKGLQVETEAALELCEGLLVLVEASGVGVSGGGKLIQGGPVDVLGDIGSGSEVV